MDYETDKGKKGEEYEVENMPTIRIILKSQETKNLEDKQFIVRGPKFMPNKHLRLCVRKSPCGEGTNTFDAFEMKIHTRIVDIKCSPNSVSDITNFKIKPGVDINIKIWNN